MTTSIEVSRSVLTPVKCFLHRVFPIGFYDDQYEDIVLKRLFKPRKDCVPVSLRGSIDWEGRALATDRNWRMQLQGWTMFHPVMNIFDDCENQEVLVDYFFDVVSSWHSVYGADNPRIVTSRMPDSYAWYDMSVGFRALVLAFFIERISYHRLKITGEQTSLLSALTRIHIENLSFDEAFSLNNHGFFQIQGLMALLKLQAQDHNFGLDSYAISKMNELVNDQFTVDGIHKEHSPHYHFYATDTIQAIMDSGWYDAEKSLVELVEKAQAVKCWMVDPEKRPICVGDSILTYQKDLTTPVKTEAKALVGDFHSAGYCAIRSDWESDDSFMLFMTGMYHTKAHKHRDCLSFDLYEKGRRVVCDSGKYGYRSDKYRSYFLSSRAHNSVEIEDFDIIKMKPYGSILSPVKRIGSVYELSGKLDYPALSHRRSLRYKPRNWLFVRDDLQCKRARTVTQWFHLEEEFRLVSASGSTVKLTTSDGIIVTIECLTPGMDTVIFNGDDDSMQGFVSKNDYQYSAAVAIGFKSNCREKRIETIISYSEDTSWSSLISQKAIQSTSLASQVQKSLERKPLAGVPHSVISTRDLCLSEGISTKAVYFEDVPFRFYSDVKSQSDTLLVLLPGASDRKKGDIDFQRHSWSKDIRCSVLSFSDPTLSTENDISLGWFQYRSGTDAISRLSHLIEKIREINKSRFKRIILFGSSAGGYVCLKLAELMSNITCIAVNPQMHLPNYVRSHYEAMIETCYGTTPSAVERSDSAHLLTVNAERVIESENRVAIVQNVFDLKHMNKHLGYVFGDAIAARQEVSNFEDVTPKEGLSFIYYQDQILKHSPPNKEDTLKLLERYGC